MNHVLTLIRPVKPNMGNTARPDLIVHDIYSFAIGIALLLMIFHLGHALYQWIQSTFLSSKPDVAIMERRARFVRKLNRIQRNKKFTYGISFDYSGYSMTEGASSSLTKSQKIHLHLVEWWIMKARSIYRMVKTEITSILLNSLGSFLLFLNFFLKLHFFCFLFLFSVYLGD